MTTEKQRDGKVEEILHLLGPLGQRVGGLFAMMELAEKEITEARARHPLAEFMIQKSFEILAPDVGMFEGKHEELYRSHCRELLERVAEGASTKELRYGTKAEVMSVLSTWSSAHPPGSQGAALMAHLFAEIFPEQAEVADEGIFREPWDGADDELFGAMARKIQKETNRGLA